MPKREHYGYVLFDTKTTVLAVVNIIIEHFKEYAERDVRPPHFIIAWQPMKLPHLPMNPQKKKRITQQKI